MLARGNFRRGQLETTDGRRQLAELLPEFIDDIGRLEFVEYPDKGTEGVADEEQNPLLPEAGGL